MCIRDSHQRTQGVAAKNVQHVENPQFPPGDQLVFDEVYRPHLPKATASVGSKGTGRFSPRRPFLLTGFCSSICRYRRYTRLGLTRQPCRRSTAVTVSYTHLTLPTNR